MSHPRWAGFILPHQQGGEEQPRVEAQEQPIEDPAMGYDVYQKVGTDGKEVDEVHGCYRQFDGRDDGFQHPIFINIVSSFHFYHWSFDSVLDIWSFPSLSTPGFTWWWWWFVWLGESFFMIFISLFTMRALFWLSLGACSYVFAYRLLVHVSFLSGIVLHLVICC